MIKVGQIYKTPEGIGVIYNHNDYQPFVDILSKYGLGIYTHKYVEEKCQLIAEYSTWQEAVNSKEFKG